MKITTFLICCFGTYLLTTQAVYSRSIATDDATEERVLKRSLWSIMAKIHAVKQNPTEPPSTTRAQDRRDNLEEMLRILRIMESGMDTEKSGFKRTVKSLGDLSTVTGKGTTDINPTTGPTPTGGLTTGPTPTGGPTTGPTPTGNAGGLTTGPTPTGNAGGPTTGPTPTGTAEGQTTGPTPTGRPTTVPRPTRPYPTGKRGLTTGRHTAGPNPTGKRGQTTGPNPTVTNLKHDNMLIRELESILLARSVNYVALYDYTAADDDEVSFKEDDVIIDVSVIDDGWIEGRVQRTGEYGMIPANYVGQQ